MLLAKCMASWIKLGEDWTLKKAMKKNLVIILKNPGTSCNIGCIYCAEERKKYVSVDKQITLAQLRSIAKLSKEYSLNVLFHGGEPMLLNSAYYEAAMNIFEEYNEDVCFGIQTNATRIDDDWISFFKKNRRRLGISVSLDGPTSVNKFRLTKDKKETYEIVRNNVKKLGENGIKTGMICTIVSSTLGKEKELFQMLSDFDNLQFVKLNPCMDRNQDGTVPFWGISPGQYFDFVNNFFDIMIKNSAWENFYVEPIISVLKRLQGVTSSFCNYSDKKCTNFISIYPDGTITSCDNFNLRDGFIGRLEDQMAFDNILYFQENEGLKTTYGNLMSKCVECAYYDLCKGGCIAARKRYEDNDEYCNGIKRMIDHFREVYESIK